jgi:HK97 family phage prohead protease
MQIAMTPRRKTFGAETEALADKRQIWVICSTEQVDRSGDVVVQSGIDVTNFSGTRTVLWNHDQDQPIARCVEIGIKSGLLRALVEFPEPGISAKSDEIYGLVKAGIINGVSIGFIPLDAEPVDKKNPRKGLRFEKCELLEFSLVSVPANPGAIITQRSLKPKAAPRMTLKGLCAVADLAWLLQGLGWQVDCAEDEAAREGDDSPVPAMLAEALNQLGAALIAMTQEEVSELLGTDGADGDDADMMFMRLPAPFRKLLLSKVAKSGRTFSADNKATMVEACKSIRDGHDAILSMLGNEPADDGEGEEKRLAAQRAKAKRAREIEVLAFKHA